MELLHSLQQWPLPAIVALIAGIVILVVPKLLNYAVAVYLLLIGTFGVLHYAQGGPVRPEALVALVAGVLVLVRPAILSWVVGGYLILVGLLGAGVLRF